MDMVPIQTTVTLKEKVAGVEVKRAHEQTERGGVVTRRGTKKGENNM